MTSRRRSNDPRTAVAYVRASTDDQRLSPTAQRDQIEAWAAREGITVLAWHVDAGVSGGSEIADRPALVAALGELRSCRAGILVVARRDRLARDVWIAATIERAASAAGARVVAADGTANGSTPADQFMRTVIDAASQYERGLIRARTRAALAAKKARGERVGQIPYGYSATSDGKLETNAAERAVIEIVRELHDAGLSHRSIVRELEARGVVSRVGRPFQATQIARMLAA